MRDSLAWVPEWIHHQVQCSLKQEGARLTDLVRRGETEDTNARFMDDIRRFFFTLEFDGQKFRQLIVSADTARLPLPSVLSPSGSMLAVCLSINKLEALPKNNGRDHSVPYSIVTSDT